VQSKRTSAWVLFKQFLQKANDWLGHTGLGTATACSLSASNTPLHTHHYSAAHTEETSSCLLQHQYTCQVSSLLPITGCMRCRQAMAVNCHCLHTAGHHLSTAYTPVQHCSHRRNKLYSVASAARPLSGDTCVRLSPAPKDHLVNAVSSLGPSFSCPASAVLLLRCRRPLPWPAAPAAVACLLLLLLWRQAPHLRSGVLQPFGAPKLDDPQAGGGLASTAHRKAQSAQHAQHSKPTTSR
jgi:hypothetical protein